MEALGGSHVRITQFWKMKKFNKSFSNNLLIIIPPAEKKEKKKSPHRKSTNAFYRKQRIKLNFMLTAARDPAAE